MASNDDKDINLTPPPKRKKYNERSSNITETIVLSDDDTDASDSDKTDIPDSLIAVADVGSVEDRCPSAKVVSSFTKNELTVLSWNIDGLDERAIEVRTFGVFESIHNHKPDIIVLQEVVDENLKVLRQLCNKYVFTVYKVANYYNAIMVKKDKALIQADNKHFDFTNSEMGRYLLMQELIINGTSLVILTTHLESCANTSNKRKEQLSICFDSMTKYMKTSNVILSGDLNIRENEIKALGGPPEGISDAWEVCGCDTSKKFTWDLLLNDNLNFGSSKPRARYDRMYYGSLKDKGIKCSSFQLVGEQRIEACNLFPSDHFGVLVKFSL